MLIRGGKIYHHQQLLRDHEVILADGLIQELRPASSLHADLILSEDEILSPSFTDLHIHGARGKDTMDASLESLQTIADALLEEGVTGFLATTMTEPIERIEAALSACHAFQAQQQHGARLLGVHLEGPFLSEAHKGAQPGEYLKNPDQLRLKKWQEQFPGLIKLITVAPELPEALDFIKYATSLGIVISIGHTNATFAEAQLGIDAGASYATHLYNAMSGVDHRFPGGAAAALLMDDRVTAELIVDGVHIMPEMIRFTVKCKGLDHLILITDAMRAKCLKAGTYTLGGQTVLVDEHGVVRLQSNGVLAGSTLKLNQALRNMQAFTQINIEQLLPLVTVRPLDLLKISKSGRLEIGQEANLVILSKDFNVKGVIHHGNLVYEA